MSKPSTTATVVVKLDEKRQIRLERRHLYRLERQTGQTVTELFSQLDRGSYAAMVDFVWAGLLHAHPDMVPEDVTEFLTFDRIKEAAEAIAVALRPVLGNERDAEGNAGGSGSEKHDSESGAGASPSESPTTSTSEQTPSS